MLPEKDASTWECGVEYKVGKGCSYVIMFIQPDSKGEEILLGMNAPEGVRSGGMKC